MNAPREDNQPRPCPKAESGVTCEECIDFLMDYLDGLLPEPQRAQFETHLALCHPCATYLDNYRQAIALVAQTGRVSQPRSGQEVPSGMVEAILKARKA